MSCLDKDRDKCMKMVGVLHQQLMEFVRLLPRGAPSTQQLVEDALPLAAVDYEVRPKVVPAIPVTTWPASGSGARDPMHDAPTHARVEISQQSEEPPPEDRDTDA